MSLDEITDEERRAIASLRRLAKRWPDSLKLLSMNGGLCVIHTADEDFVAGFADAGDRQDRILADINGIPNDGGAW